MSDEPHNKGGAQKGNRNNAKGKAWTDALKRQLAQYTTDKIAMGTALNEIAKTCIRQAIEGDSMARTEIANRLDGKPKEHIEATFTQHLVDMTDAELLDVIRTEGKQEPEVQH